MKVTNNNHLVRPAQTLGYKPLDDRWFRRPRDLPPFDFWAIQAMLMEPTIRLGLAMRAAPLMAAEFAYKEGEDWKPGLACEDEVVGAFILRQLKTIWQQLDQIVSDQIWGWCAGEMTFRLTEQRTVEIDKILPRHANDCRLLELDGHPWGIRVSRIEDSPRGVVDLPFPFAFWHAHRPQPGRHYGDSIMEGAYSPWADKWLEGGALSVRRKFMFKDAYGGTDMTYPEGTTMVGTEAVSNESIAQEIVQQLEAGGVTTRPSDRDNEGNEKWTITRASVPGNPTHILQFPKDLDVEQLRGMEISDDVLTAEATGSWAGKTVPMQAFYNGLETWLRCKLRAIKPTIDYLIMLNFGRKYWYEITTKPLAMQAMEQQGEKKAPDQGQQPGQNQGQSPFGNAPQQQQGQQFNGGQNPGQNGGNFPGQRMGLDPVQAVGEGVLNAAELVKAARIAMQGRGLTLMGLETPEPGAAPPAKPEPQIVVNNHFPEGFVRVEPAAVTVGSPEVTVEAPITIQPPEITINIPDQPPPVVNVEAPIVNVPEQAAPVVNVTSPGITVNVPEPKEYDIVPERDEKTGLIKKLKRVRKN